MGTLFALLCVLPVIFCIAYLIFGGGGGDPGSSSFPEQYRD